MVFLDDRQESLRGLERAVELRSISQAQITVLFVLPKLPTEFATWPVEDDREEYRSGLLRAVQRWQQERVSATAPGIPVEVLTTYGDTSVEVIRRAIIGKHDLVIKTARGHEADRRVFFGSTAMHLIRKCPCPVWIVAPTPPPPVTHVLAAVDPADPPESMALARRVVEAACALSKSLDAELDVLHVWNAPAEIMMRRHFGESDAEGYVNTVRDGTAARLETVLHGLPIRREQIHLRRGVPATEIAKFAAGRRSEAVVMGSVGRSFLGGLLIGEKAEEILNRVDTGVFVLKPEGFVSPIQLQEPSSDRD